jgi:hypothetical protein
MKVNMNNKTEPYQLKISTTVIIVILAILIYAVLSIWSNWIVAVIKEKFELDDSQVGLFWVAIILSVITTLAFIVFRTNPVSILGISGKYVKSKAVNLNK